MKKIASIEVNFPEFVELSEQDQRDLVDLVARICRRYEMQNIARVMWPFGIGYKMLCNPMMLSDDEPIPFDDSTFQIECSERADYRWPCAKCGIEQGDHKGHIIEPKAGDCEFEPQPRELVTTAGSA